MLIQLPQSNPPVPQPRWNQNPLLVRVKAPDRNLIVETYPFLNNGSNASFFSEKLATQLGLSGCSIPLTLTIMEREKSRSTSQVGSLQVMDLEVENAVELSYVLIRPRLPNAPWKPCKKMPFCKMATTQSRCHGRTTHPVSSPSQHRLCSGIKICEGRTQPVEMTFFRRDMWGRPKLSEFHERLWPSSPCCVSPRQVRKSSHRIRLFC